MPEAFDPGGIGLGQGQRQQRPLRVRTHRREVGQIHRERFPADRERVGVHGEVAPRHQRVAHGDQVAITRRHQHRAIVADAEQHVLAASALRRREAADQCEFVDGRGHINGGIRCHARCARACRGRR
jgi:hypothetical protein